MLAAASAEDDGDPGTNHAADGIGRPALGCGAMPTEQQDPTADPTVDPTVDPTWTIDTALVHLGRPPREPGQPLNEPIEAASTFHAGADVEYARDGTRGSQALEAAIGGLEGGHALVFSSGMAAATAMLDTVPTGGIVVAPIHAYTGVSVRARHLHEAGRIDLRTVDIADTEQIASAAQGATMIWLETPTNPMMEIADLPAVADIARAQGATLVCDNTFSSPMGQRPIDFGADVVLHSATKIIGGHSDLLAGALVFADPQAAEQMHPRRTILGGFPGALECFLALRGLRTLALRWRQAQASAQVIAERLQEHPAVARVRYPGLPDDPGFARAERLLNGPGTVLSIELHGGVPQADALCERVRLWVYATSLGGVESLLERRRRWALENERVPESLVRLSVGIEDVEDLWADLEAALQPL